MSWLTRPRPRRAVRWQPPRGLVRVGVSALAVGLIGVTAAAATLGPGGVTADPAAVPPVVVASSAAGSTVGRAAGPVATARDERATRTALRTELTADAVPGQPEARVLDAFDVDLSTVGSRYATVALTLRTGPDSDAKSRGAAKAGSKLAITSTTDGGWRLVVRANRGYWVKDRYLSKTKPVTTTSGLSDAPCKSGSAMESGLTRDAIRVHRAVCALFPQVSSYGGSRGGGGYHATGQAVDIMIGNSDVGWQIAKWVRANAKRLGVSEVIYSQQIWTVQRGGEGWRPMSDRGSATANHYDHVHVSVYGSAGTG